LIFPSPSGCRSSTFSWVTEFSRSGRRPAEDLSIELSLLRAVAQLVLPGKRRDNDVVAQGGASQAGARGKTRGTGCRSECAVGSGSLFDQSSVQLLRFRLGEASSEFLRPLGGDDGLSTEQYSRPPRVRLCGGQVVLGTWVDQLRTQAASRAELVASQGVPVASSQSRLGLVEVEGVDVTLSTEFTGSPRFAGNLSSTALAWEGRAGTGTRQPILLPFVRNHPLGWFPGMPGGNPLGSLISCLSGLVHSHPSLN